MTSASTGEPVEIPGFDAGLVQRPSKIAGWAASSPDAELADEPILTLSLGATVLGTLRRDRPDPRGASDSGQSGALTGFEVPDYGLAAFALMSGLGSFQIAIDVRAPSEPPLMLTAQVEASAPAAPLGIRHGITKAVRLVDLWLAGSRELSLRFEATQKTAKTLDAYQSVDSKLVRVASDCPLGSFAAIVSMTLINPFEPILLVFKGEDRSIDAIDLLPFPSLVRGGMHAAERLIVGRGSDDVGETATLSARLVTAWSQREANPSRCIRTIEIDPATSTGLEPVLNADFLAWVSGRLGITLLSDESVVPDFIRKKLRKAASPGGGNTLHLPANALPTISALLGSLPSDAAAGRMTGGFGIVEAGRYGRVWSVWQPPMAEMVEDLQLAGAPRLAPALTISRSDDAGDARQAHLPWPLALSFREAPTRIQRQGPFEVAPDFSGPLLRKSSSPDTSVSVLVPASAGATGSVALLDSLAQQSNVQISKIVVCVHEPENDELSRALAGLFPDRHETVAVPASAGRLEQIVAGRDLLAPGRLFLADAGTILTDHRTLSTLSQMVDAEGVSSAGLLLRVVADKMPQVSAGYSFAGIDLSASPALSFAPIDATVWRSPSTYPVVANSMAAMVTTREQIETLCSAGSTMMRPESDDLLLGLHLLNNGGLNVCTTIVSAFTSSMARPSQVSISLPYQLSPAELATITQAATIVQRVA